MLIKNKTNKTQHNIPYWKSNKYGFEIFLDYDEEVLSKLVDFNIQGDNLYYGGFYLEDNKLIYVLYW